MYSQTSQIHEHDREIHSQALGISLTQFDRLVSSANNAYTVIKDLGPFYGKEEIKEPTFRIAAEPVVLPKGSKEVLEDLGNDLLHLGKALVKLPESEKKKLGAGLDFSLPPTWRIDAIISESGELRVNEIEGVDSASALMMAEQLAYNLQRIEDSTAAKLIDAFYAMFPHSKLPLKLALIRTDIAHGPHTANHRRLIHFISMLSNGNVTISILDEAQLRSEVIKPNWGEFNGVLNETPLTPQELSDLGISQEQLISTGNYIALGNKGVFALLFDRKLEDFWKKNLGDGRFQRLRSLLLPSYFIESVQDIETAPAHNKIVKISWAGNNTALVNRSRGVAMPNGDLEQSSRERWDMLKDLLSQGVRIIAQDYVLPKKIPAFLRKKGTTLEAVEWYNRVCVKYVAEGNPNHEQAPNVALTATEVTLGPDVIPAGRKCAFTAGAFA